MAEKASAWIAIVAVLGMTVTITMSGPLENNFDGRNKKLERRAADPPETWQERWLEHNQPLKRKSFDNNVAIYYDKDVSNDITWPFSFLSQAWSYTVKKYGAFGDDGRLYAIFHANKYGGGHPSTNFDESHDYRNVIDCGKSGDNVWASGTGNDLDMPAHELSHIVELASKNIKGSPAFKIWGDSKWAEIFVYDLYLGIGRKDDAQRAYDSNINKVDNFPRANTFWFRDWFYPIYRQLGNPDSLNTYFTLLSQTFPTKTSSNCKFDFKEYSREMNMGEFIHFFCGATGTDLRALALTAFGNKDKQGNDWQPQLQQAKRDFPTVAYLNDITSQATLWVSKENRGGASDKEGSSKLIDNLYNTKFYLIGFRPVLTIRFTFPTPQTVSQFTITSANDNPDRDPKNFKFSGSNDDKVYVNLHERNNEAFNGRQLTKKYTIPNNEAFTYYKVSVVGSNGSPDLQIAEIRLLHL